MSKKPIFRSFYGFSWFAWSLG